MYMTLHAAHASPYSNLFIKISARNRKTIGRDGCVPIERMTETFQVIFRVSLVMRSVPLPFPDKSHANDVGAHGRQTGNSLSVLSDSSAVAGHVWPNDHDPAPLSTDARDSSRFSGDGGRTERPERDNRNVGISTRRKEPQRGDTRLVKRDRSTEGTQVPAETGYLGNSRPNLVPDIGLLCQAVQELEALYPDINTLPSEVRMREPGPGGLAYKTIRQGEKSEDKTITYQRPDGCSQGNDSLPRSNPSTGASAARVPYALGYSVRTDSPCGTLVTKGP